MGQGESGLLSPNKAGKSKQWRLTAVNRSHFEVLHVIGEGGFGKVWRVVYKKNKKVYAMKEMSKVRVIHKRNEKGVRFERDLLARLSHNFIVNMHYSFQDYNSLYLVMDYMAGGDLRYHLSQKVVFNEEQSKFFFACIIEALAYIHKNNIIHRDLKPENFVLDDRGYLRVTDFGVANLISSNTVINNASGTPGYMAPETMAKLPQMFTVDYFALGVIGYELMYNKRPFQGNKTNEVKASLLSKQIRIICPPSDWSKESADFINSLLIRKAKYRLGANGINELINHAWFNGFQWNSLRARTLIPPFVPMASDNFRQVVNEEKETQTVLEQYQRYKERDNYVSLFIGFTFNNWADESITLPKISTAHSTRAMGNYCYFHETPHLLPFALPHQIDEEGKGLLQSQADLFKKQLLKRKASIGQRKFLKLSHSSLLCTGQIEKRAIIDSSLKLNHKIPHISFNLNQ